jgi:hypothetical protein
MSECIMERRRTQGDQVVVEVWHRTIARGDADWRPIACGGGIVLPGNGVERDPTCPQCLTLEAPP